ncbi:hypothetical protein H0I76_07095 [Limibaculum sp. M0105]|uniref:Uncharacterized protein n=1 Tax=Thermohalobaculum xanthum TaxID=2753746 RepID=A0A8J7M681_9RHOB|nr:hypothetical protein [Thermohalobaculum xanthum]MBK0398950.1 hypothetical protein [Thermohalobaculum xanthum]
MVDFKKAPDGTGARMSDLIQVQANQTTIESAPQGLFTLEQWFIIAMAGMAISLLMLVAGLVLAWRRKRRRKIAGQ